MGSDSAGPDQPATGQDSAVDESQTALSRLQKKLADHKRRTKRDHSRAARFRADEAAKLDALALESGETSAGMLRLIVLAATKDDIRPATLLGEIEEMKAVIRLQQDMLAEIGSARSIQDAEEYRRVVSKAQRAVKWPDKVLADLDRYLQS